MTVKPGKLRIGTRGSPLALRQTEIVCAELARVRPDLVAAEADLVAAEAAATAVAGAVAPRTELCWQEVEPAVPMLRPQPVGRHRHTRPDRTAGRRTSAAMGE